MRLSYLAITFFMAASMLPPEHVIRRSFLVVDWLTLDYVY
jgi:hypothetical protein